MTQEDKQLLLKDLCARLTYGVKIELMPITRDKCTTLTPMILRDYFISDDVNYLPYLRLMSSMTEEERKEYLHITLCDVIDCEAWNEVDWLNSHHFDYRNLIKKGLALEAPIDMYKID